MPRERPASSVRSRSRKLGRRGYSFVTPGLDPGGPFFARGRMAGSSPAIASPDSGLRVCPVSRFSRSSFSSPSDVAARIVKWFVEGTIWKHLWITLVESVLAFVIGSVAGVLIGFWFAQQPRVAAVFDPYVKMINALPRVVLAPIFALWLGLGIWSKVALGVTLVFFIVFFNVYQGVKEVSPTVLD